MTTTPEEHLRANAERLLAAGRAEGIEVNGPLGTWLEAQAQTLVALAGVFHGQTQGIDTVLARIEGASATEIRYLREAIEGANHVTRQAEVAIRAAQQAQTGLVVERELITQKMIKETLPMFAEKLQGALVIEADAWNAKKRDTRFALAAAIAGAIFMAGYCFSWWEDSAPVTAFQRCLAHPVEANGELYCQASGLFNAAAITTGQTRN